MDLSFPHIFFIMLGCDCQCTPFCHIVGAGVLHHNYTRWLPGASNAKTDQSRITQKRGPQNSQIYPPFPDLFVVFYLKSRKENTSGRKDVTFLEFWDASINTQLSHPGILQITLKFQKNLTKKKKKSTQRCTRHINLTAFLTEQISGIPCISLSNIEQTLTAL